MATGRRPFAAGGALLLAAGVALGAWSAHALHGADAGRAATAALYAMVHGLALIALDDGRRGKASTLALWLLAAGTLLFCGSLAMRALAGWSSALAPFGGSLLIAGWLVAAVALWRR